MHSTENDTSLLQHQRPLDYQAKHLPIEHLLPSLSADEKQAWDILTKSDWLTAPIIASEWPFSLCVEGHWLYGRIDRIISKQNSLSDFTPHPNPLPQGERGLLANTSPLGGEVETVNETKSSFTVSDEGYLSVFCVSRLRKPYKLAYNASI